MNRTTKAFLLLVIGVCVMAAVVLYNSLSGGPRSISYLGQTYWLPLVIGGLLILGFVWLSRKKM
ncbi:MAG: hypothetical protein GX978_03160 [Tissierellia bacterium]|nr:hypothetical protein [Tissierellia bacterium]